jgi:signal transduction histidine kinase
MPIFLGRRSIVALLASLVLLIGMIAATAWLQSRLRLDQIWVDRTYEIQLRLARIGALAQAAETASRGYVVSHDESSLRERRDALSAVHDELSLLTATMSDNPQQAQGLLQLRKAIDEQIAHLDTLVQVESAGQHAEAVALIRSGKGNQLLTQVQRAIQSLREREQQLLQQRKDATHESALLTQGGVISALILAMMLGFIVVHDARQQFHTLSTAHQALVESNQRLNQEAAQRLQLEGQLRHAQKMDAIGQLTGGIAHDFNNMLAVIIGSLNLARRRIARADANFGTLIEQALGGAERAATLTSRLLAFSRQQALSPQPLDTNRFVANMSDMIGRSLGETIKVETVLAAELWLTRVDPNQLENAILNLAVNGRDAMRAGGKLTLETANVRVAAAHAGESGDVPPGEYVSLAVTDTGKGMTEDVVARAFDPFFTTKNVGEGTGLGLSQVYGFVKQSGGQIKIWSALGKGTSVVLYLPRFFGTANKAARSAAPKRPLSVPTAQEGE